MRRATFRGRTLPNVYKLTLLIEITIKYLLVLPSEHLIYLSFSMLQPRSVCVEYYMKGIIYFPVDGPIKTSLSC